MDAEGAKPAVSVGMDAVANVSGGKMPLSRPEKDLCLPANEMRTARMGADDKGEIVCEESRRYEQGETTYVMY